MAPSISQVLHRLIGQDDCVRINRRWLDLQERRRDAEQPARRQRREVEKFAIFRGASWSVHHACSNGDLLPEDRATPSAANYTNPIKIASNRQIRCTLTRLNGVTANGDIGGWM